MSAPFLLPMACDQHESANGSLALTHWSQRGPWLLFLHGLGDSGAVWESVIPSFCDTHRVITLDLLGHGRSTWSREGGYSVDAHLDDVRGVLERLGASVALVGHSLGGQLALELAAQCPERVRKLVLVDSGPELKAEGIAQVQRTFALGNYFSDQQEFEHLLARTYPLASAAALARLARSELVETPEGLRRRRDPAVVGTQWDQPTDAPGSVSRRLWRALSAVGCPTLLVRGLASAMLSESAMQRMLNMLEDGSAITVERSGHNVMLDNPRALAAAVAPFLGATTWQSAASETRPRVD